ncbi:VOC family protein [Thiotrichales bacterium 19S3-7]|nr:VOC family protein [Thiotrichales bacterium 19S3-7]MCF6801908.1 VOC family protein [Thiotrichales bacterium 19S3-11]
MFKINKIDHIGIRVMEFDRAIRFYEKLNFKLTREDYKENVVVLKHDSGVEINLLGSGNDSNQAKNILMDMPNKYPGYTHYAINVASINETKNYIENELNITITEGPITFGDGKTSIFIRDPDSNVIEFTQAEN